MSQINQWIRYLLLVGVVVSFIVFFGQPKGARTGSACSPGTSNLVAMVNGEGVSRDVFEFFREQNQETFQKYAQQGVDPERLRALVDEQTRASLVRRYLMSQEAVGLGLDVSHEALVADFQSNPGFQGADGQFDRELAERYVNHTGLGQREYAAQHKRDVLMRNFSRFVASPVRVSDAEVRDEILRAGTRVTLRIATASKPALRHMLFVGDDAEAQAIKARARVLAGESFADVAKQVSADEATRKDGGDLGTFPRGRMMPAFDEAAFSLEPGKISGPVKTDRGVHLILVESHEPASQTPFEQVQNKLAEDLLREDKAAEAAQVAANRVLEAVKAGTSFAKAAEAQKLPVIVTPPFGYREVAVPGLSGVPDLHEVALALTPEHPVPQRVFSDAENLYVVELQTREAPSEEQIAGEMSATRDRLLQRERALTTQLWYTQRAKQLDAAGKIRQFEIADRRGAAN